MSSQFWKHARSNTALTRQWSRRARAPLSFILEEVNTRMVNRAQLLRPVGGGVVHQGCLHPQALSGVQNLFSGRDFSVFAPESIELPAAAEDQAAATFLARLWPGRSAAPKTRQAACLPANSPLPVPEETQAIVWSPLWLHSVENPEQLLTDWLRVLKPEGGVFFSCFGPDTGKELQSFAQAMGADWPDFADMHDVGDLVNQQGFSDPVMEMEKLTLTYTSPEKLLEDWRALSGNSLATRQKGLCTPGQYQRALVALEGFRNPETQRIPLTLELVYGHAWKVKRQPKMDIATVKLSDIGGRRAAR